MKNNELVRISVTELIRPHFFRAARDAGNIHACFSVAIPKATTPDILVPILRGQVGTGIINGQIRGETQNEWVVSSEYSPVILDNIVSGQSPYMQGLLRKAESSGMKIDALLAGIPATIVFLYREGAPPTLTLFAVILDPTEIEAQYDAAVQIIFEATPVDM